MILPSCSIFSTNRHGLNLCRNHLKTILPNNLKKRLAVSEEKIFKVMLFSLFLMMQQPVQSYKLNETFLLSLNLKSTTNETFLLSLNLKRTTSETFLLSLNLKRTTNETFLLSLNLKRTTNETFLLSLNLKRTTNETFL